MSPGKKGENKLYDLRRRLTPIVNRSLRRNVQEYIKYTKRRANTQQFSPTKEETELYNQVTNYLLRDELYAFSSSQRTLITILLLKLLGSSSFAISHTLDAIAFRVEKEADAGVRRDNSGKKYFDDDIIDSISEDTDEEIFVTDSYTTLSEIEIIAMKNEAEDLRKMAKLAKSITHESKGDALLLALKKGFEELPKYNAERKALIFTESTRTQTYLANLLRNNGYSGKIVVFNGSGGDENSNEIYKNWLDKHSGTDLVSGVKTSDKRTAIVDYFRDEAEIMIATEAAGEGINLQFCSMVINYDLPWNPQRIEQRIGRCHRYGQKSDVLVFNFLNKENRVEQRILQLLEEKFKLFDGVFGASDEILGAIESGFDFERNIANIILTSVRTPDQIDKDFDRIQDMFSDRIDNQRKIARKHLLDNFDSDVQEKLKIARGANKYYMDRHTEWLWKVSKLILSDYASFHSEGFTLHTIPSFSRDSPLGTYAYSDEAKAQNRYRTNHPLAQQVVEVAKGLSTPNGSLEFKYTGSNNKISLLEPYLGHEGVLSLVKYTRKSEVQEEEYLVVLAQTEDGHPLLGDTAAKLFDLPGVYKDSTFINPDFDSMKSNAIDKIEKEAAQRDNQLLNEEFTKIASRANDLRRSARIKLKKREIEIRQLKKDFQLETDMSKKLDIQRKQIMLQRKQDDEEQEYRKNSRVIDDEMLSLNDTIRASIESKPVVETIFTTEWSLK